MSDREKFLEEKMSYLEPKKTELEIRGAHFNLKAPVTGSVTTNDAVVVGFGDGIVRFFRDEGDPNVVKAHEGVVLSIATNGENVFTGGEDGKFLKISPGGNIAEIADFNTRWVDTVAAKQGMIACSSGSTVYIWSEGQKKEKTLDHPSTVGGLAFDKNGSRLAVSCYGGVTLWERKERRWKSSRLVWKGSHSKVSFSPDGKYIVTTMQESELHGWRLRDKVDLAMRGYPAKIKSFAWVGDTPHLATGGDHQAICWPFDGKDGPLGREPVCIADCGKKISTFIEPLIGENAIFVGFNDGTVLLSELDENKSPFVIRNPKGSEISAISVSSNRSHILIGDIEGNILWSPLWKN